MEKKEEKSKERRECEWCDGTGCAGYGGAENDCRYCKGTGVVDAN